jgi:hypothetical protein
MPHQYFRRIENHHGEVNSRRIGNTQSNRENSQNIPISYLGAPYILDLSWKDGNNSPVQQIGVFNLDLQGLLDEGIIRIDSDPNYLRLIIKHDVDGRIIVKLNNNGNSIDIGNY